MEKAPGNQNLKDIDTSIRDFPNVLLKIPTNIEYTIEELEFEFDLKWEHLEPLLDKSCTYNIQNKKITIISKETPGPAKEELEKLKKKKEQEEAERETQYQQEKTQEKLKKIYGLTFYKTKEYRSIPKKDWPEQHTELLDECIRLGIIQVWTHHGEKPMLVLEGHYPSHNNRMRH
jgi:hypothetical protein